MDASPEYFPLVVSGIEAAIEAGDKNTGLKLALTLRKSGPEKHLLESLATVAFSLNPWGGREISKEQASKLEKLIASLKPRIDASPPKLALLGGYIEGRVHLASSSFSEAVSALEIAAGRNPTAATLVWYGLATKLEKGASAALELLDKHPDVSDPSLLDLKTQCLLECDRVEQAATALEGLRATGALPSQVKELGMVLAIKKGDFAAALKKMPKVIDAEQMLPAIELYYQLKDAGDRKGIIKLADAFDEELKSCAKSMRTWHSRKSGLAVKKLDQDRLDTCTGALAGRLMWGRTDPQKIKRALTQVTSKAGSGLIFKVGEAMASWLVDGRGAALKILDWVKMQKPEAAPVRCALGGAYLEMGMPKKTLEALDSVDDPEALALRYLAKKEIKGESTDSLVDAAAKRSKNSPHPALAYVIAHSQYAAGEYEKALDTVNSVLPNAGHWTAELAEIGAKSINLWGDRADADRLLTNTATKAGSSSGVDEWWEIKLAKARLNLYRGGKFVKRAGVILDELRREGASDARLFYGLAVMQLRKGDQKTTIGYLKKSLRLNPALNAAYSQLKKMGELDDETAATMKKVLPGFKP
jgi:predicted Zn-dependent protease